MKSTVYLLKYNNYYNRIVKKENNLSDYITPDYLVHTQSGVSFNPNDGITANLVVNFNFGKADYAVVVNEDTDEIESRWFILECSRNLKGQYNILLYRDSIVDYYDNVITAPVFIEKATLGDSDPMIFNSEDMAFNQIKTNETLLKDKSKVAWIVGYLASDATTADDNINFSCTKDPDIVVSNLDELPSIIKNGETYKVVKSSEFSTILKYTSVYNPDNATNIELFSAIDGSGLSRYSYRTGNLTSRLQYNNPGENNLTVPILNLQLSQAWKLGIKENKAAINTAYEAYFQDGAGSPKVYIEDKYLDYIEKTIYVSSTNKYYYVTRDYINETNMGLNLVNNSNLDLEIKKYAEANLIDKGCTLVNNSWNSIRLNMVTTNYKINIVEISNKNSNTITISNTRKHPLDAPYDIFCIPYGELKVTESSTTNFYSQKEISYAAANALIKKYGGNSPKLYDIQLLPYCPLQNLIINNEIDIKSSQVGVDYNYITTNSIKTSIILWAQASTFSFDIDESINVSNVKLESECDMYRLCSPNYNSIFEFNAAKNGGVKYFNVDCTYKPYSPYIHVNPNFGRLYGTDFNDARGLICSGDFSMTQVNDTFATYERQNANYEKQFNRQIENMEVKNKYQRISEITSIATGALGTGVSTGVATGNALAGVGAGVASAIGGTFDFGINEKLRAEAIDYTKDQFGYNLDNIKALPNVLTKVGPFNNNNKLYPVLEYYTCTNEEKQALINKLLYNGMRVGRIGTIMEYLHEKPTYIKGKVIRLENTNDDYNLVNTIANEINKGVFI